MFENRTIDLQIPPSQGMTQVVDRVVLGDTFEPYERHVYKIPRAATPPWVLPLEDLDRIISEALSIPGHL